MNEILKVTAKDQVSGLALDRAVLHAQYGDVSGALEYDRFGLPCDRFKTPAIIIIEARQLGAVEALEAIIFDRAGLR